jgi:ubiquinone/menaquinone biosynthesis C-methylase UbiE
MDPQQLTWEGIYGYDKLSDLLSLGLANRWAQPYIDTMSYKIHHHWVQQNVEPR